MKRNFLDYIHKYSKMKLNLGCGKTNKPEYWGIDVQDLPGVDEVKDLTEGIPREDKLWDEVFCHDFLEHIPQEECIPIMEEIWRVLKPGGKVIIVFPSTDCGGQGAFQDPTHLSFWNETKLKYFLHGKYGGLGGLYDSQAWFKPIQIFTYLNEWHVPYVNAVLEREL